MATAGVQLQQRCTSYVVPGARRHRRRVASSLQLLVHSACSWEAARAVEGQLSTKLHCVQAAEPAEPGPENWGQAQPRKRIKLPSFAPQRPAAAQPLAGPHSGPAARSQPSGKAAAAASSKAKPQQQPAGKAIAGRQQDNQAPSRAAATPSAAAEASPVQAAESPQGNGAAEVPSGSQPQLGQTMQSPFKQPRQQQQAAKEQGLQQRSAALAQAAQSPVQHAVSFEEPSSSR